MKVSPHLYRLKLAALAILGYGVLLAMLMILLAMAAATVFLLVAGHVWWVLLKLKLLLLPFFAVPYVIVRSLWVRISDPVGYKLSPEEVPTLFAEVEAIRRTINAPKIHRIILTNDFNAGIAQVPRLGVLGWHRNTLVIGLQLLLAMSPPETRAVLAHEMGHLRNQDSRFNGWVYRIRVSWWRIMTALNQAEHWATRSLSAFFDWYAPYFNAYSFALARTNEYEADAIAARLTAPDVAASALVNASVWPFLNDRYYWKPLVARAEDDPMPPAAAMSGLERFRLSVLSTHPTGWDEVFTQVMAQETEYGDTHPALCDRLKALHEKPPGPGQFNGTSAAREWLGEKAERILADFDQSWLNENSAVWKQRYDQVGGARRNLAELRAKENILTKEERWKLAALTEAVDPSVDPLPLYRQYDAMFPHEAHADLAIGRLLLQREDPAGLACLERAALEIGVGTLACQVAYSYALKKGDKDLAGLWRTRAERHADIQGQAQRECQSMPFKENLTGSLLQSEAIDRLRSELQRVDWVKAAWICRRRLQCAPTLPVYLLAVEPKRIPGIREDALQQELRTLQYPGETYVMFTWGEQKALAQLVIAAGTKVV